MLEYLRAFGWLEIDVETDSSAGEEPLAAERLGKELDDFALYSSPEFTARLEQHMRDVRAEVAGEQSSTK